MKNNNARWRRNRRKTEANWAAKLSGEMSRPYELRNHKRIAELEKKLQGC